VNHSDEAICPLTPSVAVSYLLKNIGFLGKGIVTDLYIHAEICTNIERWVNINAYSPSLILRFPNYNGGLTQWGKTMSISYAP
jgi:hypothetical protein